MTPSQLLLVSIFLLVSGLLASGWYLSRTKTENLAYWPLAWAALFAAGGVRVSTITDQVAVGGGVVFGVLTLAGALQYVGRRVPRSLIVAGFLFAFATSAMSFTDMYGAFRPLVVTVNIVTIAYAAMLVHTAKPDDDRSKLHKLIAPGLLLMAAVMLTDYLGYTTDEFKIGIWALVGIPLATVQIGSVVDRIRLRAVHASEALAESVSLLQATLESTSEGLLVVNRDRTISSLNATFGKLWNIPQEILDQRDSNLALGYAMTQLKDPEAFFNKVKSLYDNPEAESFDTLEFNDGRVFERFSRPQYVGDEIVGRVWSFRDVTERVRAEELAARHQNHLEELVEERTQELIESRDRLRHADRLAAVGTLAAGVAHQINNPVGVILNSAEYALKCGDDEDAKETYRRALEVNAEEAQRCADIVRSMLQFARDERVETRVDDLNRVVQSACRATEGYALDRSASLKLTLCAEPLNVRMSAIEIEQVVVNILRNAVESREARASVEVTTERKRDVARITISDNGHGITPENQDRIFDPFYSTRLEQGGTGLGLSVAHGIVTEHKGHIRAESAEGKGTVFVVELPLVTGE